MGIALALLRRFWWVLPLLAVAGWVQTLRVELDHARARAQDLQQRIDAHEAVDRENAKTAKTEKETADAKYHSEHDAALLLGNTLSERVREYEDRLRARPVPAAGEPRPAVGGGPPAQDPVAGALEAVVAACARDAARLDNAHQWAASLAAGAPLPDPDRR